MSQDSSGRMSIVPSRAFDDKRLGNAALVVLGLLGTYSDRDGWCWPAQATLARRRGISRQAVMKQLEILVEMGYLEKRARQRQNGSNTSCMYRIVFDADLPAEQDNLAGIVEEIHEKPAPVGTPTGGGPKVVPKKDAPAFKTFDIAVQLAAICKMDFDMNKGRLLSDAKLMIPAPGFSPALMENVYGEGGAWYQRDFRGRKGQPPTPKQIRETWAQYAGVDEITVTETNPQEAWFNG